MTYLSSSQLYRAAAKLEADATVHVDRDDCCVMCAAPLPAGSMANRVTRDMFDQGFTNGPDLRGKSGRHVCGDCMALWGKDWLQKYSKTFATTQGVFKFASNEQQAAFFLNPPPPPFCAIFSTRKQQHMIWRTPLSLSSDYYVVRLDGDLLTIRHQALMEALRAFRHAEQVMDTVPLNRTGKKLRKPAALFSRDLAMSSMGTVRPDVEELMDQVGDQWVVDTLHALTMGEWWALNVIRHYDPDNPPAYEPAIEAA